MFRCFYLHQKEVPNKWVWVAQRQKWNSYTMKSLQLAWYGENCTDTNYMIFTAGLVWGKLPWYELHDLYSWPGMGKTALIRTTWSLQLAWYGENCTDTNYMSLLVWLTNSVILCCLITVLCPTLGDPRDCSRPGSSVLHYLPEFAQTYVHWVCDAI